MKNVSFIANSQDDLHCVPAVFRMIYKYFFDDDLSWEEVDEILQVIPGKGVWTIPGLIDLSDRGLEITNIEPIDYERLSNEKEEYIRKTFGEETSKYYLEKSNLLSVIGFIPEFLEKVKQEERIATVDDIINNLDEKAIIGAEVNSQILNNSHNFNLHYVLIYDFDGTNLILHDPGLPPAEERKVLIRDFEKTFNFPGANPGITIFRK